MPLLLCTVKAVVAWFILMLVGTNLVGMTVGGLAHPFLQYKTENAFLAAEAAKGRRAMVASTAFFTLVTVVYLALLLNFWNLGVVAAALMLMVARIPDLLLEIRSGQKGAKASGAVGHPHISDVLASDSCAVDQPLRSLT